MKPKLNKKTGMMEMVIDLKKTRPISPEVQKNIAELAARPDSGIDTSDIPELTDEDWARAVRGNRFMRPVKVNTSVRLDADIVHWLKSQGRGYQTRLNEFLRRMMTEEIQAQQ